MLSIVMRHLRRQTLETKPIQFDFMPGELHALRNAGQLTDEELARAQAAVRRRADDRDRLQYGDRPVNQTKRGFDVIVEPPVTEQPDGGGGATMRPRHNDPHD